MSIYDQVNDQLKAAMKAQDKDRLRALRGIRAGIITAMKEDGSDSLPDDKCLDVLRRLAKQRRDSIDAYSSAGREDLAADEQSELLVIETFLPQVADEAQTRAWVQAAIEETGASGPGGVGRVMAAVMKAHKGLVDGGLTKKIAAELLGA